MRFYALWVGGALLLGNLVAWSEIREGNFLHITFFDVGQGDAIFIETPQGHRMMIDGGPSRTAILEKLNKTLPFWVRDIDLVILTHPDADHLTGLVAVLEEYQVKMVLWTGVESKSRIVEAWKEALGEEHAQVVLASAPQRLVWSPHSYTAFMSIVFPTLQDRERAKSPNDLSLVTRLVFGMHSFLFTGDIESPAEQVLLEGGENVKSDVLKISHHGSKTSSSESFIGAVSPDVAVIQVGRNNRYGHPAKEVLERLEQYGIRVLRTDVHGDILITATPRIFRVTPAVIDSPSVMQTL